MPEAPLPWQRLLKGEAASRAYEAVAAIARDLAALEIAGAPGFGLNGGKAGLALFFAYQERTLDDPASGDRAEALLDQAADELGSAETPVPSLYNGFAGLAWVVEHLTAGGEGGDEGDGDEGDDDEGDDDPNAGIDAALESVLRRSPWDGEFDLLGGLVGYGVYALERGSRRTAVPLLPRIVECLRERSDPAGGGRVWHRRDLPEPYPDPGMAHGAAGVIALLARLVREVEGQALRTEAASLLAAAVEGVLGPDLGADPDTGETAWCAGDLGLSVALLAAGRAAGRPEWEAAGWSRALAASGRRFGPDETLDPALCHGTAGLGHLFHRLYRLTGEEAFRAAAVAWIERTLARRRPGQGIGGYLRRGRLDGGGMGWLPDAGFLGGAAGIGLALLAAVSPVEPEWDRLLLLSGRP